MTTTVPVLSFENIRHLYGETVALENISLSVDKGQILALLGPSGCGKSTLLRIAAGLERQSAGRLVIDGRAMADGQVFTPPEQRGVGLVFQDYALFPHLDVMDNVAFGLRKTLAGKQAREKSMAMLERVGLAHRARDYPHMLSGGEQQRIALARALVPQPAVLLLDEPFSNLDQNLRRDMRAQTVALLKDARAAAILVTHDPDDAAAVADRIAIMRAGAIVQVGALAAIYNRPVDRFVLGFFSDIETFPAEVRAGVAATPFGMRPARNMPDGQAQLCIRKIAFARADKAPAFDAKVLGRRLLGERVAMRVRIAGYDSPFEIFLNAHEASAVGDTFALTFRAADAFVFSGVG